MEQIYVHADPLKDRLVAVIVPEKTYLLNVVKQLEKNDYQMLSENADNLLEAANDPRVVQHMMEKLDVEAKKVNLKG